MSGLVLLAAFAASVVYAAVTGAWSILLVTFPAMLIAFAVIGSETGDGQPQAKHRRVAATLGLAWTAHGPLPFVMFRRRRR